jgi:hypothetical protein
MFEDFDFGDFWEDSDYAREQYVDEPVTTELVRSVEAELGFRLPAAYVALMRSQNGGIPKRTCFPTSSATTWSTDHVAITGIMGIGRTKTYSLLGSLGSRFMQQQWDYPTWGICVCDCPSAGHDMVMLDYRACGPEGEPAVVHVDQEVDYRVTLLARDFETFVRGLVDESVYDTSAEDLKAKLRAIEQGTFSTKLTKLLTRASGPAEHETALRRLLHTIATQKGYFALHDDPLSHLVYDVLFALHTAAHKVAKPQRFLKAYPDLIAFGDGEITTGGYAEGFVEDWLELRMKAGDIVARDGRLTVSDAHRAAIEAQLAAFR